MAVPYSSGWKAYVDGKETKIYQANGMYMGIPVEKGAHTIELSYTTPGLKIGAAVSAAAWIIFIVFVIAMQKKKTIKKEK